MAHSAPNCQRHGMKNKRTFASLAFAVWCGMAVAGTAYVMLSNNGDATVMVRGEPLLPHDSIRLEVPAGMSGFISVMPPPGYELNARPFHPMLADESQYALGVSYRKIDGQPEAKPVVNPEPAFTPQLATAPQPAAEQKTRHTPTPALKQNSIPPPVPGPNPAAKPVRAGSGPVAAPPKGMVLVPAGTNEGVDPDFGPYRLACPGFYMDRTEITLDQWRQVYDWAIRHGYRFDHEGEGRAGNHPVHSVSWYDCAKWCNARSESEGREPVYWRGGEPLRADTPMGDNDVVSVFAKNGYRLPGRAYWEYAARGGLRSRRFPWGDTISWNVANYRATTCDEALKMVQIQADISPGGSFSGAMKTEPPVNYDENVIGVIGENIMEDVRNYLARIQKGMDGLYDDLPHLTILYNPAYYAKFGALTAPAEAFAPNGFGLFNMVGNVAEWLQSPDFDGAPISFGAYFGGGWNSISAACRFGKVSLKKHHEASGHIGFRSILPAGKALDEGSGPTSFFPDPPIYHRDSENREMVKNFQIVPSYGSVLVPIFTEFGFEMRHHDPRLLKTYGDVFLEFLATSAERTEIIEESIPNFSSGTSGETSREADVMQPPTPPSRAKATPQQSRPPAQVTVPLFHVRRLPFEEADLGVFFHKGDATSTPARHFSFGKITFTLTNRTKYRIVHCEMYISYRAGFGQDISFTDIPPGEMHDADSDFTLLGSHASDDLQGVPFIFPAMVICVDDEGNAFDLYERDANLSVGFLGI